MEASGRILSRDDSPELIWSEFYQRASQVIRLYGEVVAYYVKSKNLSDWQNLIGEDGRDWSSVQVLQRMEQHRGVLNSVGAEEKLYESMGKLIQWFTEEPEDVTQKLEFHKACTKFVELLPFEDQFPFDWDEMPADQVWQNRQICGSFYPLTFQMNLPVRWFVHYGNLFRKKTKLSEPPKPPDLNKILNEELGRNKNCLDSDSDEDELFVRHSLGKEPLENVIDSLKRKKEDREAREARERSENQPTGSEGQTQPEPDDEPKEENNGSEVYAFESNDDND